MNEQLQPQYNPPRYYSPHHQYQQDQEEPLLPRKKNYQRENMIMLYWAEESKDGVVELLVALKNKAKNTFFKIR